MIRIKSIAIFLLAFTAYQYKVWGQSGSWADYQNQKDYTGSGMTITIANAGQLARLAAVVNGGADFSSVTINLTADINLGEHYWVPIGTALHPFNGKFVGFSHTVSGLNINDADLDNAGLFGYARGATISNLTVSAGSIAADENVGILAGSLISSTLTNCSVSATGISGTRNVSALVGYRDLVSGITSCTVTATDVSLANNGDNSTMLSDCRNKPCNVTLSGRTLYKDGAWNTICLPFDYDPAYGVLAGDGVEIYTLSGAAIDGTRLNLTFGDNVAGNGVMRAGVPYIIKWNDTGANLANPVFQGVVPRVTAPADYDNKVSGDTRVRLRGTFSQQALAAQDQSILFMGGNNTLYYPGKSTNIGSCRAYFKIGEDVSSAKLLSDFSFIFGEETVTGIVELEARSEESGVGSKNEWFDLQGCKLAGKPTRKGIYIINGKKVLIK